MLNNQGILLILIAPSGGGKTTLVNMLKEGGNYVASISYTTRAPRGVEQDGVDYHFITRERFEALKEVDFFAECAYVHGNYYGTGKQNSYDLVATGKSIIFDVDYQGAINLKKAFPEALSIFIVPPSLAILTQRLSGRGTDSDEAIALRLQNALKEIESAPNFDAFLINDDLELCFKQLQTIIDAHRHSIPHYRSSLDAVLKGFKGESN